MKDLGKFRVNVCTFMGREENVKILHIYIEEALKINAIDRYYMIDMTRNQSDHDFIFNEYQRLSCDFPERIFIVNRDERSQQIQNKSVLNTVGFWSPFYKFLNTFEDDDVIIKMDDDTLFIDIETLRAAAELRWRNKDPIIMHSNCINNGITAFHQAKKNIWRFADKEINMYPPCGLTGPLFSHPEIACKCHSQFTNDLSIDSASLDNYRLKENIYFNARISINCMFLLGCDRDLFVGIDGQDEYIASCKLGQELDRPNMIIGDFITAHHTYGVQEPCMEEYETFELYKKLSNKWFEKDAPFENKDINMSYGKTSAIKRDENYVTRSWMDNNSYVIQNNRTKEYMVLNSQAKEQKDPYTRKNNGEFALETVLEADLQNKYAFNISENIYTCSDLLRSVSPHKEAAYFNSFFVSRFYQHNYSRNKINLKEQPDNTFLIESASDPDMFLCSTNHKTTGETKYIFKKTGHNSIPDSWNLISMADKKDHILLSKIIRKDLKKYINDPTYIEAAFNEDFPKLVGPRGFYWTIRGHLWEFIKNKNGYYFIKCIDDERNSVWLTCNSERPLTTQLKHRASWRLLNNNNKYEIREMVSNMAIHVNNTGDLIMHSQATLFDIDINED